MNLYQKTRPSLSPRISPATSLVRILHSKNSILERFGVYLPRQIKNRNERPGAKDQVVDEENRRISFIGIFFQKGDEPVRVIRDDGIDLHRDEFFHFLFPVERINAYPDPFLMRTEDILLC